jgi:hypothetical protein
MAHAAESTHWYGRDGTPAYTVKAKAGHDRPTTLADARKLGLVPSVTTVIKCADRPGLTNWMLDQAILAALTLPVIAGETSDAYLARIKRDSKEQAKKAAERGTAIHAAIQGHYEGKPPAEEFWPHVRGAVAEVEKWMKGPWTAERSFSHVMGFGGKVDLSHQWAVLDFKSKEFGPDDDLRTWDEQGMQIGAYREGLLTPRAKGAIVYVSATHPGLAKLIEIPEEELQKGWKCFYSLLQFWKAKNNFDRAFERAMAA